MSDTLTDDTFTTSDGVTISFTHYTAPHQGAPRVVFLHSLALDRTIWDGVVQRMLPSADVLTYDFRGHGRSDRRAGTYTVELFAEDLVSLLDHVSWQNATVVGCSMGGSVALAFAARFMRRTRGLLLVDTTAWYGDDAVAQFKERAATARTKGLKGMIEFQLPRWFSDGFRASHPDLLKHLTETFVANDLECYAASCGLLGAVDMRASLPSLRMPTGVVVGADDQATPLEMSRYLHNHIAESTLAVIPAARHLTPLEDPETIAAELHDVLRRW